MCKWFDVYDKQITFPLSCCLWGNRDTKVMCLALCLSVCSDGDENISIY